MQRSASCVEPLKPIIPPSQSHQSFLAKHTSISLNASVPYSLSISLVSAPAVLPPFANHSISAFFQSSTSLGSPIFRRPSCTPLQDTQSFLELEDPSFMATLRALSPVSPFPLRLPRIRKDSHVAKSEAPSSPTPAIAQPRPRFSSLNSHSHPFIDEHHVESYADAGFSDAVSQPSPTVTISQSSHWPTRGCDATPFNSPTNPTFPELDANRGIHETIKQLEELARDLKSMDINVCTLRPPTRRLVRPPPRFSSLPLKNTMRTSYDSDSSPSSSRSSLSGSSTEIACLPVSESPPARLAYLGEDIAATEEEPHAAMPRIVLTIPSAEQLAAGLIELQQPSTSEASAGAGEEGDEVQWVEEYGQWGNSSEDEYDSDNDRASIISLVFDHDDTSMFPSPPNSPPVLTPTVRHFPTLASSFPDADTFDRPRRSNSSFTCAPALTPRIPTVHLHLPHPRRLPCGSAAHFPNPFSVAQGSRRRRRRRLSPCLTAWR